MRVVVVVVVVIVIIAPKNMSISTYKLLQFFYSSEIMSAETP